jgi:cardiolipin synthase A/B
MERYFTLIDGATCALRHRSDVIETRARHGRCAGLRSVEVSGFMRNADANAPFQTLPKNRSLDRYLLHPDAARPGHHVDVLVGGGETYGAMLGAIRTATTEILVETYIWTDDATGEKFVEALAERARAGLRIHVLVDGFGSLGLSDATRRRLRDAGVWLAVFNPVRPWQRRWAWSVRDHRKLLVVDGVVAFIGGLNIADEYAPTDWGGRGWHDVHARINGSAVSALRRHFFSAWRHATAEEGELPPLALPVPSCSGTARVQVLGIGGLRERRRIRRHYQFAIRQARATVRIMGGYFIPDRGWRRLLRNAVRRGVDVRVMFPHRSDVPAVRWAAHATYGSLLRAGVKVYEWLPSMLHAKVLSVDGRMCAIGSYNLDRRSLLLNWELSVIVGDDVTTGLLDRRFDADLARCIEIERVPWARRGILNRLVERFFYALRRWL